MDINFYISNTATEILNNSILIENLSKIADNTNFNFWYALLTILPAIALAIFAG